MCKREQSCSEAGSQRSLWLTNPLARTNSVSHKNYLNLFPEWCLIGSRLPPTRSHLIKILLPLTSAHWEYTNSGRQTTSKSAHTFSNSQLMVTFRAQPGPAWQGLLGRSLLLPTAPHTFSLFHMGVMRLSLPLGCKPSGSFPLLYLWIVIRCELILEKSFVSSTLPWDLQFYSSGRIQSLPLFQSCTSRKVDHL